MDWNDLKLILAVCRSGSLSGAARLLGVNHSTVFRRINQIETSMGVRFFERLPHGYDMTEAGEAVMRVAERIDNQVLDLARELQGKDLRLQGSIRVTAPEGITVFLLGSYLEKFCRQHPNIHIDLVTTSTTLELVRREADLAIRVTSNPPDTTIGHRICRFKSTFYATQSYLEKTGELPLNQHKLIIMEDGLDWLPRSIWKTKEQINANLIFRSNNMLAVLNAVKSDLGITALPCFVGDRQKELVRLIDPPKALDNELWVLIHPDLRRTARVRILMSALVEAFSCDAPLIEGKAETQAMSMLKT